MNGAELLRVRVAFGALGAVPVFLMGWLFYVQVAQAATLPREGRAPLPLVAATADRQGQRERLVPAPRGRILDRRGVALASDCPAYDVRARIDVPAKCRKDGELFRDWIGRISDAFARALVVDPEIEDRLEARDRACSRIREALHRRWNVAELPVRGVVSETRMRPADVLISAEVDRLEVIEALRSMHRSDDWPTVHVDFVPTFRRVYPERDLTYGIVGHTQTYWAVDAAGNRFLQTSGMAGLEALAAMEPRTDGVRRFLADGRTRPYFVAPAEGAPKPNILQSTIDLELQRIAVHELREQAERGVRGNAEKKAKWGALVLVDMHSGDLLAAASWHRDAKMENGASFTPYQSTFEPGSIVKPLVLGYAHEVGALDWEQQFDCGPRSAEYVERIASLGRRGGVRDDHACGVLDAHGILVNSSNIGAAYVGLLLSREQWRDYMSAYGFGTTLGLNLPHEGVGGWPDSFDPSTPLRRFRAYSATSFSFGYELSATPLQIARAYLRLFRGLGSELRLVRSLEVDGVAQELPPTAGVGPHLRPHVIEHVRQALEDVVSNDPHATGSYLHRQMLKELGIDLHGVVAGKTGTAATRVGVGNNRLEMHKNASFVGFLPADAPRWLAVSVLQKDDGASFYGGSYAAPPAVKLLLQCRKLHSERDRRQEAPSGSGAGGSTGGQTRLEPLRTGLRSPGSSGWVVPGSSGSPRDTR